MGGVCGRQRFHPWWPRKLAGGEEIIRALVATPYYPPHIGGAELYCREISVGLAQGHGWRIVVATSAHNGDPGVAEEDEVVVHRLPVRRVVSATPLSAAWFRRLRELVAEERPDVVVGHSPVPFMADLAALASGRSIPFVLTYHAGTLKKQRLPFDLLAAAYERVVLPRVIRHAKAVIHYSPDFARAHRRLLDEKGHFIAPGVDAERFRPGKSAAAAESPVVLYVGRLERASRWKGVRDLIDAISIVRRDIEGVRLHLVGSGDDVSDLRQHARSRDLDGAVAFCGPLSGSRLVDAYRGASVVALPSRSAAESFGIALLEASACGRPVIGSRVGGIPSVVRDGETGFLVPPASPVDLAQAIIRVLDDQEFASRLGRAGVELARREFAWSTAVELTRRVLQEVAA